MTSTVTAGIDIGSATTKTVLFDIDKILSFSIVPTGAHPLSAARASMKRALKIAGCTFNDIKYSVSTGYGRRTADFVDEPVNEIHANARGAVWLASSEGAGTVRTIIDVGGQDTKAIAISEKGNVTDFAMNDKCAAGTGRFLEVMCGVLGIALGELGELSLRAKETVTINSTCTVFAESEVVSLIAQQKPKEDIIAGLHRSIAHRIVTMAKQVGVREVILFDGGGAKNIGLKKALEEELGMNLFVPPEPQIVTAVGAALMAQHKIKK
jgi:predicted CoA-substrate-specific enzyme activase